MPWAAVGAVAGAVISGDAADSASDAQVQSTEKADATQRYMYDTARADNAPFLANGTAANNRLAYLLGLNTSPSGAPAAVPAALTRDQIRQELLPQYTTQTSRTPSWQEMGDNYDPNYSIPGATTVDEAALNAAIESRLAQQASDAAKAQAAQQQAQTAAQNDPAYGSLLRRFTTADLNADPVYQSGLQFGLSEGEKGINRQAAATGSLLSGATLKALTRYGNDYGSTKANESYNRFTNDQTNQYNRLAGISGTGQQANSLVASAGQNYANNVSANQIGAGNARASGYIAGANGINGAIGSGINGYLQNKLLSGLSNNSSYGNFLSSNQGILNQGLTPNDLYTGL